MKTVKSISLSEELWERVEKAREHEPRSAFIERMLEGALTALEAPPPSRGGPRRPSVDDRAARYMPPIAGVLLPSAPTPAETVMYACPEDRCPYMSTKPGTCVHHRTKKLTRVAKT